ncbi:MAG: hypothetical protein Tsb0017_13450 [Geothermobacteraceae bacterium]
MPSDTSTLLGKIAGYTEILAKDPRSTVFVSLAEAYRQLGMLDDALEILDKGIVHLPRFVPGYVARGRILAQKGQLADATVAFEQALAIESDNLPAIKGLARVRYRQGYTDKARALLEKGRSIKPDDPVIIKMLASLGGDAAETAEPISSEAAREAEPQSEHEVESGGEQPAILTSTLAELYVRQGLLHDAARVYREILRRDPDNQKARQRLVELKQQIESQEQEGAPAASPDAPEPVPVSPEPDVDLAEESRPQAEPPETSKEQLVDIYQRWLAAIDQRRAHVR